MGLRGVTSTITVTNDERIKTINTAHLPSNWMHQISHFAHRDSKGQGSDFVPSSPSRTPGVARPPRGAVIGWC